MTVPDDAALLTAWGRGDAHAGDALLRRHFDGLYLFFATKVDGPVDDLVQGTLLSAVEQRDRLRDPTRFRGYLFRIARNRLVDHYRARARHRTEPVTSRVAGADARPSLVLAEGEEQQLMLRSLRRLPLDLQVAVGLHYFQGLKIQEIAEATDTPAGTVKYRLSTARERLREQVEVLAASPALAQSTLVGLDTWLQSVGAIATESGAEPSP